LFSYREGIIDLNAEVSDGAFDFGVAKQELHGPQVAGSTIDERCLCSPQRMGAKEIRIEPDGGDPFRKEPCLLPRGHALSKAASAGE